MFLITTFLISFFFLLLFFRCIRLVYGIQATKDQESVKIVGLLGRGQQQAITYGCHEES
jgi:hypothetical protein